MKQDAKIRHRLRFNNWSRVYDKSILQWIVFNTSHNTFFKEMTSSMKKDLKVLDVGCGTGKFAFRLHNKNRDLKIHGVDLSEEMINKAKAKLKTDEIEFRTGDVEELPYESHTFDIITCSNSFHHYPKPVVVLKEFHRVLAPGGHVMIVDGRVNDPWGWWVFQVGVRFYEGWQVWHPSQKYFSRLLSDAGFDPVIFRNVPARWPFPLPLVLVKGRAQK